MFKIKILIIVSAIFLIIINTCNKIKAFENKYSYNYMLHMEEIKKDYPKENLTEKNTGWIEKNSISPLISSSLMTKELKIENIKINPENNMSGYKQKINSNIASLIPEMALQELGNVNFKNRSDGGFNMNTNQNITDKDYVNISFQNKNLKNTFSTNINYSHTITDKTSGSLMLNVNETNDFSSVIGIDHNMGWSDITIEYFQDKTSDPGEYTINWKQQESLIPGTPIIYSFSGGINRSSEKEWSKNAGFLLSHQPVTFGENGMLIFSCSGNMNWQENKTDLINGNMTLSFSEKFSFNASLTREETDLDNGNNVNTSAGIGIMSNITDKFNLQVYYSFMENESTGDSSESYFKNQDLTGSFSYNFSNGNYISMELGYNPEKDKFNYLGGDINIFSGKNQSFKIKPQYDFLEKEFSIYLETVFIR